MSAAPTPRSRLRTVPRRTWLLATLVGLSLAAAAALVLGGHVRPDSIQTLVARAGPYGWGAFVLIVVAMELLWLPRMTVLMASGVLFGPVQGALLSLVGDSFSAIICYTLARRGGRDAVARALAKRPRAAAVVDLLAKRQGVATLIALRVCPVAHYTLVSYATGLVGVPWRTFLVGNTLGLVPCAVLYPTFGDAMLRPTSPVFLVSLGFFVAMFVGTGVVARRLLATVRPGAPTSGDAYPNCDGAK